jgi:hypothetical protein
MGLFLIYSHDKKKKGTHMKQLKYILPLLLTIITIAIYNPIQTQASTSNYTLTWEDGYWSNIGIKEQAGNHFRNINKIPLESNEFTFTGMSTSNPTSIHFWNGSTHLGVYFAAGYSHIGYFGSAYLGITVQNGVTYSVPTGATHFAITSQSSLHTNLVMSYPTPQPLYEIQNKWQLNTISTNGIVSSSTGNAVTNPANFITNNTITINNNPAGANLNIIFKDAQNGVISQVNYTGHIGYVPIPNNAASFFLSASMSNNLYQQIELGYGDPEQITLRFYNHNNTLLATSVVFQGTTAVYNGGTPTREGHVFTGWFPALGVVQVNTDYVAQFTQLITYDVTFLDWDNSLIGTVTVEQGETAVPPYIPTRTGYTFNSWLPPVANVQGDITTVAQYTANTYLVTWNSDNVEILANQVAHDVNVLSQAPAITKENHNLVGWKIDPTETLVTSGQVVTAPLSLTAVWEPVPTYTVTWRDVDFTTLKIEYVIQSGLAVPPVYSAGSGLQLVGWTPDPTQPITQNTTFVAVVEQIPTTPTEPSDYSPISDLFGGVIGASIGAVMTLGTIELYGITLNSLIFLFISMTVGLWILKAIRG